MSDYDPPQIVLSDNIYFDGDFNDYNHESRDVKYITFHCDVKFNEYLLLPPEIIVSDDVKSLISECAHSAILGSNLNELYLMTIP